MGRRKKEDTGGVKKKTFRFDADLQYTLDAITVAVRDKVPTKYSNRDPSEQEVLDYVLKDYLRLRPAYGVLVGGPDEG